MIKGFYTARAGLNAHQEHMNTIANNLANVNTVGFKAMRTSFTDLIYQNINRQQVENEAQVGHGVKVNKNDVLMAAGPLEPTNFVLDFAVVGENGFFAVETAQGETLYTRAGDFRLSNEDDTYYLVDGNNHKVLDADGSTIEVTFDEENNLEFDPGILGVYSFRNPYGLSLVGSNCYIATEQSGEAEALEEPVIKQGYIEGSGTEIANEMAKVIESSKAFSFASRMVQVADEVAQTVNSLR